MTCPKHIQIEQCRQQGYDGWHPFTGWHTGYVYRIKPKPKVKKWQWAYPSYKHTSGWIVTDEPMSEKEALSRYLGNIQKIDCTMIEVDDE